MMGSTQRDRKEAKSFFIIAILFVMCYLAAGVLVEKAGLLATLISFTGAFVFLLVLSVQPNIRKVREKLVESTLVGACFGGIMASVIVYLLSSSIGYEQMLGLAGPVIYGPFSEETAKFLSILSLTALTKLKWRERFEITRLSGGVGLGFGILETFSYMFRGIPFMITIGRLALTLPFHIGSAMLLGIGLAKQKRSLQVLIMLFAICWTAHSLSNCLVQCNWWFLQFALNWCLLSVSYLTSANLVSQSVP